MIVGAAGPTAGTADAPEGSAPAGPVVVVHLVQGVAAAMLMRLLVDWVLRRKNNILDLTTKDFLCVDSELGRVAVYKKGGHTPPSPLR